MDKNEYKRRRERGLCVDCGNAPLEGQIKCAVCRQKAIDRYEKTKASGMCVDCRKRRRMKHNSRCKQCAVRQSNQAKVRRKDRKEKKQCVVCGKPSVKSLCAVCLAKGKELRDERKRFGLCRKCGEPVVVGKSKCQVCLDAEVRYLDALRQEVLQAYKARCACCGEERTEFLAIDHINNDGAAHRKRVGHSSVYRWLKKNHFPDGFQVLCYNCNWAKYRYGICPHEKERCENAKYNKEARRKRAN